MILFADNVTIRSPHKASTNFGCSTGMENATYDYALLSLIKFSVCLIASLLLAGTYAATLYYTVCREVLAILAMDASGHMTVSNCTERCDALFIMALDNEEQMIDGYCSRLCYQAIHQGIHNCHH
ncbi:hypothetical protein RRG08_056182 [Elysia crispata]|uniref:Uncharacterized protein n=1 Tax=Elysia crispata TaxID=231223 RepID=A0AAE0Z0W7_9GAST|nr:hypothetical protein RRG08_056182 [Elysia crispata]